MVLTWKQQKTLSIITGNGYEERENFEDSDLQSYAEGMMCAIEMDANQARARALLRTVRAFHLTEDEIITVVKRLKAKRLLPRDFHFNTEGVKFDD